MSNNLEKKSKEEPKILNDLFKNKLYIELKRLNLYDYYILKIQNSIYSQNFQKTFTP
jgi:hypothetical protein